MSSPAREPIVSGTAYAVHEVDGSAPTSLDDFLPAPGALVSVTLEHGGVPHVAQGVATRVGSDVCLYEKDSVVGKDTRVWTITEIGPGIFEAVHDPRF
ncbi:hypothetical protein NUM3379_20890 [Kineococcus sp. NUM-3379]